MQISATDRRTEFFADDYLCPLFVQSDLPPPQLDLLQFATEAASFDYRSAANYEAWKRIESGSSLLKIPLLLNDDPVECNVNNIALHCLAPWRLPS